MTDMTDKTLRRLVVCDDHPMFRLGICTALADLPDAEVIAQAGNGRHCIELLGQLRPDYLLLDLALPDIDGYQVLDWIRNNDLEVKTVVLSMHAERAFAERAREMGAKGYIAKEDALGEIQLALDCPAGSFYTSRSVQGQGDRPRGNAQADQMAPRLARLSPTERKIMALLANSMTSREIGENLGISVRTVQTHRANIGDKLNVHGVNRLLEIAIRYRQIFAGP